MVLRLVTILPLACITLYLLAAGCESGTETPADTCPDDPAKSEPGRCGCGIADTDSDGDGTPDCEQAEPFGQWGPAPEAAIRTTIFDEVWLDYRQHYAGFVQSDVDWDLIAADLRPRIEAATTYGEFFRLLRSAFFDLRDAHDVVWSQRICGGSPSLGLPVFWTGHDFAGKELRICLTVLDDDTALVYRASANNPAALEPGDRIVGYDDKDLRQVLNDAMKLPVCGSQPTHRETNDRWLMEAAAANFQLHQTMQVQRLGSPVVASIDTEPLRGAGFDTTFCSTQLAVGVPVPWDALPDAGARPPVTWALLPGTQIGYIYVYAWTGSADTLFLQAVQELWDTTGLIVDFRYNLGGNMFLSFPALQELFNQNIAGVFAVGVRANIDDPYAMNIITNGYGVTVNAQYYDHPIAVLTGTYAVSSGDIVGIYLASHPRARRFGRPSAGSACFDSRTGTLWEHDPYLGDLTVSRTPCIGYGGDGQPVAAGSIEPEQRVWLTPDDVAQGRDTVVQAALDWIQTQ